MRAELKKDDYLALGEVFSGVINLFMAQGKVELNQPYTFQCSFKTNSENYTLINTMKLMKESICV